MINVGLFSQSLVPEFGRVLAKVQLTACRGPTWRDFRCRCGLKRRKLQIKMFLLS